MPHDQGSGPPGDGDDNVLVQNIVDMKEFKEKSERGAGNTPPKSTTKEEKPTLTVLQIASMVVNAMLHHPGVDLFEFYHNFYVKEDSKGEMLFFEEIEDKLIKPVSATRIKCAIHKYVDDCKHFEGMYKITSTHVNHILDKWSSIVWRLGDVADVLQAHEPGYTFHRLPFSFQDDPFVDRCPLFSEMMSRTKNAAALMAWIGSLFDSDSYRQQYAWLFGHGQNGKSTLGRFLSKCLGNASKWTQPPGINDRFWTSTLIGKRLIVFGDCNNSGFVTSGLFKGITGGDVVQAEIKNGPCFDVQLHCKFLVFSNNKPNINSDVADQRRIIYCEMDAIAGEGEPDYEDRLWAEAPWILGRCWRFYQEMAGPRRPIPVEAGLAEGVAAENEELFEEVFEEFFQITGNDNDILYPIQFQKPLQDYGMKSNNVQKKFYDYIARVHGITKVNVRIGDGSRRKAYRGVIRRGSSL